MSGLSRFLEGEGTIGRWHKAFERLDLPFHARERQRPGGVRCDDRYAAIAGSKGSGRELALERRRQNGPASRQGSVEAEIVVFFVAES